MSGCQPTGDPRCYCLCHRPWHGTLPPPCYCTCRFQTIWNSSTIETLALCKHGKPVKFGCTACYAESHEEEEPKCKCGCHIGAGEDLGCCECTVLVAIRKLNNSLSELGTLVHDETHDRGNIWSRLEYLESFENRMVIEPHPRSLHERLAKIEAIFKSRTENKKEWKSFNCIICKIYLGDYEESGFNPRPTSEFICNECLNSLISK